MEEKSYRKNDSIVYRKIGQHFILVPIRNDVADFEFVYTLDEVSACIWKLIDGKLTSKEIARRLVREFEVTQEEAEEDVQRILEELKEFEGVVEVK